MSVGTESKDALVHVARGERVILDSDLARVYGVTTRRLNEQVKRNTDRFPEDFAFRLTQTEMGVLTSQCATSSSSHGGRRKPPYALTEHGAIMAANVLNSKQAIGMSVFVVRAFVQMRSKLWRDKELDRRLSELERKVENQDGEVQSLFEAVRRLLAPSEKSKNRIGF